ncbi:hypothetical protein cand_002570 [Cryptosporidium andersoni]|uniref:Uncharacterized protein n=1 Tax=Cryptosporidium andersoni TaxID=117008 RepID=A0A1J4MP03_9CRYT|nr:hypothetical protein cand_002570 [Cryptosporidium andersoni]
MKSELLITLLQFILNVVFGDNSGKFGYYEDLTQPNIIKKKELNNKELNSGYYGDTYGGYSQDLTEEWSEQKKDIGEGYWQVLEEEIELHSSNTIQNVSYKGSDFISSFENKVLSRKIANVSEVCSTVQVMSFWHFVNDIIDSIHNQLKGTIEDYKKVNNQGIYFVNINNFKESLEDTREQSKDVITSSQMFSNCKRNQDKSVKMSRTKNNNINLQSKLYDQVYKNKTSTRKKNKSEFKHECTVSSEPNALRNCGYFGKQSYYIPSNTK